MTPDFYDDLDAPCVPFKEGWPQMPITIDEAIEFLKPGNQIKVNLMKHTQKETATYLMGTLRAIINEQMEMGLIEKKDCISWMLFSTLVYAEVG